MSLEKLAKWRLRVMQYGSDIVYKIGVLYQSADTLLGVPTDITDDFDIIYVICTMAVAIRAEKRLYKATNNTP